MEKKPLTRSPVAPGQGQIGVDRIPLSVEEIQSAYNDIIMDPTLSQVYNLETNSKMKAEIVESLAKTKKFLVQTHVSERGQITNREVIDSMIVPGEKFETDAHLYCEKVSILSDTGSVLDEHYGVLLKLTNKRIFIADEDVSRVLNLTKIPNTNFPVRKKYSVGSEMRDDLWFYPVPLKNVTGVSLNISNSTRVTAELSMLYNKLGYLLAVVGLVLFVLGFSYGTGLLLLGLLTAIGGIVLAYYLPEFSTKAFPPLVSKLRLITIGALDPLTQKRIVIKFYLHSNVSIESAKDFIVLIQKLAPNIIE